MSHLKSFGNKQQEINKNFYNENALLWNEYFKKEKHGYAHSIKIVKQIIKQNDIKSIFDIGTGDATPMIEYLKLGVYVQGIDFAENSIKIAKENLKNSGCDASLVKLADINNYLPKRKFDCVLGIGVFPHLNDPKRILKSLTKNLNKNGTMIISFRNPIFCMFSLNEYSYEFFTRDLIKMDSLKEFKPKVKQFLKSKLSTPTTNLEVGMLSRFDNPFTIHEMFEQIGMQIQKIHFFHYHAMPPIFEKDNSELFNKISYKLEDSNDWKGYFMASAYIVEAKRKLRN